MATITHTEREIAHILDSEPVGVIVLKPLSETFVVSSKLTVIARSSYIKDIAFISDDASGKDIALLSELASIVNRVSSSNTTSVLVSDSATISSKATTSKLVSHIEREVLSISSETSFSNFQTIKSTSYITDKTYASTDAPYITRSLSYAYDDVFVSRPHATKDTASILDDVKLRTFSNLTVNESATITSDAVFGSSKLEVTVRDIAIARSAFSTTSFKTTIVYVERDVAYSYSRAIPPILDGGTAYTCSTETWGMSRYSNFPFSSMTKNYAAGVSLWSLSGDTDNNETIYGNVLTNKMDFGNPAFKNISQVYFNGIANGQLKLGVTADTARGKEFTYTYPLPRRNQTSLRNNRVSIGKGYFSRYYQFRLLSDGVPFELLDIEPYISQNNKRI